MSNVMNDAARGMSNAATRGAGGMKPVSYPTNQNPQSVSMKDMALNLAMGFAGMAIQRGAQAASQVTAAAIDKGKENVMDAINRAERGGGKTQSSKRGRRGGNGFGGNNNYNNSSSSGGGGESNYRSVTVQPEKVKVDFNSGVKSGVIVDPLQQNTANWSPLFILNGVFLSGTANTSRVGKYISEVLLPDIENIVQRNINFKYDISITDLRDWLYSTSDALQLHYTLESIMTYSQYQPNRNPGMIALRSTITPDILNKWNRLTQLLRDRVCPPVLLLFIRFMYQNFSFSEVSGSPIVRIMYKDLWIPETTNTRESRISAELDNLIERLINTAKVNNKILKALPQYEIKDLPKSSDIVGVDENFHTFWHNALSANGANDGLTYNYNYSGTGVTNYEYALCTDELDGMMFSCFGFDNTSTSILEPGLFTPSTKLASQCRTGCATSLLMYSNTASDKFRTPFTAEGETCCTGQLFVWTYDQTTATYSLERNGLVHTQIAQECTNLTQTQAVSEGLFTLLRM